MKSLKRLTVIGISLVSIGFGGILLAIHAYPGSNLLGGWGLILGPVYWLGLLVSFVAMLAWIMVGLLWAWRRVVKHESQGLSLAAQCKKGDKVD